LRHKSFILFLPISLFPFLVLILPLSRRSPSIEFSMEPGTGQALSEEERRHAAEAQCLSVEAQQHEAAETQHRVEEGGAEAGGEGAED
jgi:hypothetical protein